MSHGSSSPVRIRHLAPVERDPSRSVRDHRSARCGRDGGGLQGSGHAPRTGRGDQGVAGAPPESPDSADASSARPGRSRNSNIPNLCALYDIGYQDGVRLPGHGVPRWRDPRRPASKRGALPIRAGPADRLRSIAERASPGAPPGYRPPRPQTRNVMLTSTRGEAPGLRPGEATLRTGASRDDETSGMAGTLDRDRA